MVERFQQQQLASAQVGLPREDKSMSTASAIVAKAADAQRDAVLQQASKQFAQSESSFSQLSRNTAALEYAMDRARTQQQHQQRRLDAQLALIDEADNYNAITAGLKGKYAGNEQLALAEFDSQVPTLRNEFAKKYGHDPEMLRMMLPSQRQAEHSIRNELTTWGQQAKTQRLTSRLELLPQEFSSKIGAIEGGTDEQIKTYRSMKASYGAVYDMMAADVQTDTERNHIKAKKLALVQGTDEQFMNHLVGQVPPGRPGLNYLGTLQGLVSNASKAGFELEPKAQRGLVEHLEQLKGGREQQVITTIQTDGFIKSADAKLVRLALDQSQNDPEAMARIDAELKAKATGITQQIELAENEPNERIRKARILELKKELTELVGGAEKETALQRGLESIERSRRGEIRAIEGQSRAVQGFAMSVTRFNQSQNDRNIREYHGKVVAQYNEKWTKFVNETQSVLSQPSGPKQQEAMVNVARKAIGILDEARDAGAINGKEYGTRLDDIKNKVHLTNSVKVIEDKLMGFIPTGQTKVIPLTKAEKAKKELELRQQFGAMVSQEVANLDATKNAIEQLKAISTTPGEHAFIEGFLHTNLPKMYSSQRYQSLNADQRRAEIARKVRETVTEYRRGGLRQ